MFVLGQSKNKSVPFFSNVSDEVRDRLSGRVLDAQGGFRSPVLVEGEAFNPRFLPCGDASCVASGAGIDLTDPETQRWISAGNAKAAKDALAIGSLAPLPMAWVGKVLGSVFGKGVAREVIAEGGSGIGAKGLVPADTQTVLIQQVADLRATLTGSAKTSGNVGVAQIDISGIQPTMAASSRIGTPNAEQQVMGFVGEVSETFPSSVVPTASNPPQMLNRAIDSEAKILNNIAAQLGENTSVKGSINLLTERAPCASCSNVIELFRAKYPNITVNVFDNGGVIRPTKKGL
ncbi:deaminase domain-containing protein [Pseudomonas frederiksbergensis]|uniref:deaminase domain-containing protein n=1 Tax=Pseudomonas frederiksbergensis TaxID=104087 RepID=UPI000F48B811|nr:deaminase domain-containing protein [Pseudomonas frederiksbergensis]RON50091.1 hypothetical protein BK667_18890 [Pseudomonas frederiksbergensis]